ncbi:MAG: hypothetical protein IPH88_10360 [Bacteroidales bacterium]|nr:hypothetical protein [Bacteroidales bacterium]
MKYYFQDLPPKERISGFIENFLYPVFEKEGFVYSKSQERFKKKNPFFDFHVTFFKNRYNQMNEAHPIAEFEICINIHSPAYRKWEKQYYGFDIAKEGTYIDGGNASGCSNWDDTYMKNNWYSLSENDNDSLVTMLTKNFRNAALPYFSRFDSLESGIEELLKRPTDGKFLRIFDLLILSNQIPKALDFFENNNSWFEEELKKNEEESYFAWNYREEYLLRKNEYEKRLIR